MTAEQPRTERADIEALQRQADAFVALAEAKRISGFSKSKIARERKAGRFPEPVLAEKDKTGHVFLVRWSLRELLAWQTEQVKKRDELQRSGLHPEPESEPLRRGRKTWQEKERKKRAECMSPQTPEARA